MHNNLKIEKKSFGHLSSGEEVHEFSLENSSGIKLSIITYGGIVRTLFTPDNQGNLEDVVLGFDDLKSYEQGHPYFGAIIGRYGNRIAKGQFKLDGEEYTLITNNLGNHLHGGEIGFDKKVWQAEPIQEQDTVGLKMTYTSKHMEEGYPGNLDVSVTYTLTTANELVIDYHAVTDRKTVVNMTNHAYFNLTANKEDVLGHHLVINASNYLPVDETLIPTELADVEATPFDFRTSKHIGRDISVENDQLEFGGGFDHCWVLNNGKAKLKHAASVLEPNSGRKMEVYTEEPGIQFYTGNFLDDVGKGSKVYKPRSGFCLETQHYPDSPNRPDFPTTELNPGEVYSTKTIYKFSKEK